MIRSMWTAASGMVAQQMQVDTIANNLSNVNTTGFKKSRLDFQELLYLNLRMPGVITETGYQIPTGLEVGHGVRAGGSLKMFSQGNLQQTSHPFDLAIEGSGFFGIEQADGTISYTRDGSFKLDGSGQIVTTNGMRLVWDADVLPEDTIDISIAADGTVSVMRGGEDEPEVVGQIPMFRFVNPSGLESIGNNMWQHTPAAGIPEEGIAGQEGFGRLLQGFLETSNVQVVEEMVDLITAQRAYEISSKAIQTSDEMLSIANNLKR